MTSESDWTTRATALADSVCTDAPEWRDAVAATPRHLLVPRWWERIPTSPHEEWALHPTYVMELYERAYADVTLVTRVGPDHADYAQTGQRAAGEPTSSSTLPGLIVDMLHRLAPRPGVDTVLDLGTGSGYCACLLADRLGDDQVTSIDVDGYLTGTARHRLAQIGRKPRIETVDATGPIRGGPYDRIIATVSARPIPANWISALAPGGRLVATIAGTTLMITADMDHTGTATGWVASDSASFMATRSHPDYPPRLNDVYAEARDADGAYVGPPDGPTPDLWQEHGLRNLFELYAPGVEIRSVALTDRRITFLLAADGSWARAEDDGSRPLVHQTGPRLLWAGLERTRDEWENGRRYQLTDCTVTLRPGQSTLTTPTGHTYPI